jgi:radical SAM protein with 4Fe4S-binding SPASM domain
MKEICKPDAALARVVLPQKVQPGVFYVPSQFVLSFSHKGTEYAFHTFTKQLIEARLPSSAHAGEGFDDLIEAMFLVPKDRDECAYYESIAGMMRLYGQKKGVPTYTIMPTLACNARCVYCYEEGVKQVSMTPEIVEQTIRYILETRTKDRITLSWFGGEPLLRPDVIDRITTRLTEEGVPFRSVIVTNGSLITPEIIDRMLGSWKLKRVQVSMDGAEPDYLARKRYYRDADQYRTVMDAIGRLSEAGITVTVRVNVDECNWPGIPQFMEDMRRGVKHKKHVSLYFSPLMNVRAGEDDLAMWEKIVAAGHLISDAGFKPYSYTAPSMKFRANRCMADGGSVVIGPDGSLYPCEHCPPESRFGDIFRGVTDENAKRTFTRADRTRDMCRSCTFLPECTSFASCPWVDAHCREMHMLVALDAMRRIIDSKGTFTEEPDGDDAVC